MSNDAEWVEDVKRWVSSGVRPAAGLGSAGDTESPAIGYEAAHPALQARHWPDATALEFNDSN